MKNCVLFLCFAVVAGCTHQASPIPGQAEVAAGQIGSHLPDFSASDLEGHQVSSSELRGKVVLIDIWATWCAPCEKEMPGYQRLGERYGSKGFRVIGLKANMMVDAEDPRYFAKRVGVHYPLVIATNDLLHKFGGLEGLPTTLLYDRRGVLRKKIIGFEYTNVFESALKSLL